MQNKLKQIIHKPMWEMVGKHVFGKIDSTIEYTALDAKYSPHFPDGDLVYTALAYNNISKYSSAANAFTPVLPPVAITNKSMTLVVSEYANQTGNPLNTATGGTTNSINTSLTMVKNAIGSKIRIAEGPNAGDEYVIAYNGIGTNSTIVLTTTAPVAFSASTKFYLLTGSVYLGHASIPYLYDIVGNKWITRAAPIATVASNEIFMVNPHTADVSFASGNITSATATTCVVTGLTGTFDYSNSEIEILTGTGKGQVRRISDGTSSTLTVATAWTITPDSTSTYRICGDRDAFYAFANTRSYRYTLSTNTWVELAARSTLLGRGGSAVLISEQSVWSTPRTGTGIVGGQNNRYVYSFRGASTDKLDIYDIAKNIWTNDVTYGGKSLTIGSNFCAVHCNGDIIIMGGTDGQYYRFSTAKNTLTGFPQMVYPQSATTTWAQKMWVNKVVDSGTTLTYLYSYLHNSDMVFRILVF